MQVSTLTAELSLQRTNVKTALRYPGGKSKAVSKIMPLIPQEFNEYREPFIGGGSVFIAAKQRNPDATYKINDLNYDVYCFYHCLKRDPELLISSVKEIKEKTQDGRYLYNILRKAQPSGKMGRAVRYYLLNRISYSGTVESGGYSKASFEKRFTLSKIDKLEDLADLLANVEITNETYEKLLFQQGKNVFIFLDPPYWNARKSALYGTKGNLNKFFDHERFAKRVRECQHKWLITCDDSKPIRDLFSFANIFPWELKYSGLNKRTATMGKELFITNYDIEN
jgi:DNA adenine methylase